MHHALILAGDLGERLRPLSDDERPTSFLALGERRTLLQRCVDRLTPVVPLENQWVVVRPRHLVLAKAQLPTATHLLVDSCDGEADGVVRRALAAIGRLDAATAVLVQPAQHIVGDEPAYCEKIAAGLGAAVARRVRVIFHGDLGGARRVRDGNRNRSVAVGSLGGTCIDAAPVLARKSGLG